MAKVRCDNCRHIYDESGVQVRLDKCADLNERLDAGSEVPFGDCPSCGCFCYLVKPAPNIVCVVEGGCLRSVCVSPSMLPVDVTVLDGDNEGDEEHDKDYDFDSEVEKATEGLTEVA